MAFYAKKKQNKQNKQTHTLMDKSINHQGYKKTSKSILGIETLRNNVSNSFENNSF